jgi:hypothetical protein
MRLELHLLSAVILSLVSRAAIADEWAVEKGKVYVGRNGERVEIVPVKPASDNKALIRFSGTGSELDDVVLLHDVHDSDREVSFKTTLHGRGWITVSGRARWSSSKQFTLYHPKSRDGASLFFDSAKTDALDSEQVLHRFQELKAGGELEKLQAFDRKGEEARQEELFAAQLDTTNGACGSKITAAIDWRGIDDEMLKQLSISGYCSAALDAIRQICADKIGKKVVQGTLKEVQCRFGSKLKLLLEGGKVTFETVKDAPNQEEYARSQLQQKL